MFWQIPEMILCSDKNRSYLLDQRRLSEFSSSQPVVNNWETKAVHTVTEICLQMKCVLPHQPIVKEVLWRTAIFNQIVDVVCNNRETATVAFC